VIPEKMLGESSHIDIVKRDLTRNLTVLFPEIYDEIELAFEGQSSTPSKSLTLTVSCRIHSKD
jgi:hypothetical protein